MLNDVYGKLDKIILIFGIFLIFIFLMFLFDINVEKLDLYVNIVFLLNLFVYIVLNFFVCLKFKLILLILVNKLFILYIFFFYYLLL